jgi:hypothetical protein
MFLNLWSPIENQNRFRQSIFCVVRDLFEKWKLKLKTMAHTGFYVVRE